jgi:hypothetical protein
VVDRGMGGRGCPQGVSGAPASRLYQVQVGEERAGSHSPVPLQIAFPFVGVRRLCGRVSWMDKMYKCVCADWSN